MLPLGSFQSLHHANILIHLIIPYSAKKASPYFEETLNKARLTALHAVCMQIFRHIVQKSLAIHQVCLRNF